jgi:septum site-determining protein MinD
MSACANLDLLMGASRRGVFDLRRPERREAFASPHPRQTARNAVAPAGLADRDKGALTEQGVAGVIKELCGKFDWVICDSPAGIERGATLADFSIPRPRRPRRGSASILITRYDVQ